MPPSRPSRRAPVVVGLLLGLALAAGACSSGGGSGSGTAPMPTGAQAKDPVLAEGRQLYTANCARCHGTQGQGGVGPNLDRDRPIQAFPTVAEQVTFVADGRGIMPAWKGKLTHAQIEAVVRYTRQVLAPRGT